MCFRSVQNKHSACLQCDRVVRIGGPSKWADLRSSVVQGIKYSMSDFDTTHTPQTHLIMGCIHVGEI